MRKKKCLDLLEVLQAKRKCTFFFLGDLYIFSDFWFSLSVQNNIAQERGHTWTQQNIQCLRPFTNVTTSGLHAIAVAVESDVAKA